MSRGNRIVVNPDARGAFEWGYVTGALKPGTVLQVDPSVAIKHGKHTWIAYDRGADGDRPKGPYALLIEDLYQGRDATTAIATGQFCKMYLPVHGDELNLLVQNVSGTATIAKDTLLMVDDGTGTMIATTGSPENEVAVLLEDLVDVAADQLGWCRWSGL